MQTLQSALNYPTNYPKFMTGTFTSKIIQKGFVKSDGTSNLYLQIFINKERKQISLGISVAPKYFDKKKQRVKPLNDLFKDYNLIIEKKLSLVNEIQVSYRLANRTITMQGFLEDYYNPSSKTDFIKFYETELKKQKDNKIISLSTYKQQNATLQKIRRFKAHIFFYEINAELLDNFTAHLRVKEKNQPNTVYTALKNFKKYLHLANDKKIQTPLSYRYVKTKTIKGNRTFLTSEELNKMNNYYNSTFIKESHQLVLKKFLFACFTGLRISDVQKLTTENVIQDQLVFVAQKTNKLTKLKLNDSAKQFFNQNNPFTDNYEDQTINSTLKEIAKTLGIKKKISFHVARHTFATQFLLNGGKVEVLQQLLQHSKIDTTMIYVHIVEEHLNTQIHLLDNILKK